LREFGERGEMKRSAQIQRPAHEDSTPNCEKKEVAILRGLSGVKRFLGEPTKVRIIMLGEGKIDARGAQVPQWAKAITGWAVNQNKVLSNGEEVGRRTSKVDYARQGGKRSLEKGQEGGPLVKTEKEMAGHEQGNSYHERRRSRQFVMGGEGVRSRAQSTKAYKKGFQEGGSREGTVEHWGRIGPGTERLEVHSQEGGGSQWV